MTEGVLMERLADVARAQGMSWHLGPWPGANALCPSANAPEDLAHELGHFMVATPWERRSPWWGVGSPSDYPLAATYPAVATEREYAASALGILLLAWVGAPEWQVDAELGAHEWTGVRDPAWTYELRKLRRRGLIIGTSLWESWPGPRWEVSHGGVGVDLVRDRHRSRGRDRRRSAGRREEGGGWLLMTYAEREDDGRSFMVCRACGAKVEHPTLEEASRASEQHRCAEEVEVRA